MNPNHLQSKHTRYSVVWMLIHVCIVAMISQMISCSSSDSIAGTGSQAGNGRIMCMIRNNDGSPASGASVCLRPHDYISNDSQKSIYTRFDTRTNAKGEFIIDSVDTGSYCIEVNDGKAHAVLLTCAVTDTDTTVSLQEATLHPTGSLKGAITSIPGDTSGLLVQIYGLERLGVIDTSSGTFVIEDVPQGNYVIHIQTPSVDYKPVEIENIVVESSKSTDIGNIDFIHSSKWSYSKQLILNTSPTGANVAGTVTDFPVLVRLRNSNFDFKQAKVDGSDIIFTKNNGSLLPYQIERWDPNRHEAEIWVKVDTVNGNDSSQFITLYWGNDEAVNSSLGPMVFDTAKGYRGVWHLAETGGSILDATANRYNGVVFDNQTCVTGNIGFGQFFDGTGDYSNMGNVCNPDTFSFTVCAWIKKTGVNKIQTIVSKSKGGPADSSYGWLLQLDSDGAFSIFIATDTGSWSNAGTFVLTSDIWITDSSWHHVAAVADRVDNNNCRIYIDGSDVSTLPSGGDIKNIGRVVNSSPLRIGSDANGGYQWHGSIDECSIVFKAHSSSYIKLSYMNQKTDDALIIFRLKRD